MAANQCNEFTASEETPPVIVAALKSWLPELSWSRIRRLLSSRRVVIGTSLCMDESRRLQPGELVLVYEEALAKPPTASDVKVHFEDRDIVVVEKPPRMVTLRHKKERHWKKSKKQIQPALEEVLPELIYSKDREDKPSLLSVHRIDKDTSGLLVFARHDRAQKALIEQFAAHDVMRKYGAVVHGTPTQQTIHCRIVRNRGDGLRGSTTHPTEGKEAITHVVPLKSYTSTDESTTYTEVECQLETGRTHQIRIHLAELGHPVCGDSLYRSAINIEPILDNSRAPRLALHAKQLGFAHPSSGDLLEFESPWPNDIARFLKSLQ